jgi:hypothetical protein
MKYDSNLIEKCFFFYKLNEILNAKPQYNNAKKKMHFEISERKMILRLFDVLLFYSFYAIGHFFDLDYWKRR